MVGHNSEYPKQSTADMKSFVQNLLQQMVGEMGNRMDELEQSINELRFEMGMDATESPSVPSKSKDEPQGGQ